jgi:hypothetical protein
MDDMCLLGCRWPSAATTCSTRTCSRRTAAMRWYFLYLLRYTLLLQWLDYLPSTRIVGPYFFLLHSFVHSIHQVWHGHPQGLLFHAREYPAQDNDTAAPSYFPYNLGECHSTIASRPMIRGSHLILVTSMESEWDSSLITFLPLRLLPVWHAACLWWSSHGPPQHPVLPGACPCRCSALAPLPCRHAPGMRHQAAASCIPASTGMFAAWTLSQEPATPLTSMELTSRYVSPSGCNMGPMQGCHVTGAGGSAGCGSEQRAAHAPDHGRPAGDFLMF